MVEGFADSDHKTTLVHVLLTLESGGVPREIVHQASAKNLRQTALYIAAKESASAKQQEASSSSSKPSTKRPAEPWLLQESDPEAVREEARWTKALADGDKGNRLCWARARVGMTHPGPL